MGETVPFESLDAFLAVPRLTGLVLSPDGAWLVASVQTLSPDGAQYVTSLWAIDPSGGGSRRVTRSVSGESEPAFLPSGDLLFVSKRPDDGTGGAETKDVEETSSLWRLPAAGGEAELVGSRPGGLRRPLVARDTGSVVLTGSTLQGSAETDASRRAAR